MSSQATRTPLENQFIRQFGVPIDSTAVFPLSVGTYAGFTKEEYITNSATSGLAYSGMIISDLTTNKVYMLGASGNPATRGWIEVNAGTVNETFGPSNSGILFKTGNNTFAVGGLSSTNDNISIVNPSGLLGNPTIGLNPSITGITSITGVNNFRIAASSGINIDAGLGIVSVDDLNVSGTLYIGGNIDISVAAAVLAQGPIVYSGNPTIYSGSVYYTQTPYVGPTGGGAVPVSLSGHSHAYTDITNFCSGVASCVDTALTVSTGLRADFSSNTLQLALSGQAATLHSFTGTGLMVRTGGQSNNGAFSARSIAQGTNISVANGDGVSANPTISLNASITGLTDVKSSNIYATNIYTNDDQNTLNIYAPSVNVTGNLTVANLTVTGITTTVNSTAITVKDPILTLGLASGNIVTNDTLDRGLALIRDTDVTAFMGWDSSASQFVMLSSGVAVNNSGNYNPGTYGNLQINDLSASGATFNANVSVLGDLNTNSISGTNDSLYIRTQDTAIRLYDYTIWLENDVKLSTNLRLSDSASTDALVVTDGDKNIVSLTSPSLTEIGYISGVTSNIQTQLDSKQNIIPNIVTGNGTANHVAYWSNTSGLLADSNQLYWDAINNILAVGTNIPTLGVSIDATGVILARGNIRSSGMFIGNGSGLTNLNANAISGVLATGNLPTVSQTNTTAGPTSNFISTITVDSYGRIIGANTTSHTLSTTSVAGIASFSSGNFDVSSGAVSIKNSGISNINLANSSITLGATEMSLGSTYTTIAGLVGISGTSIASPTTLTFCVIDGGTP